MHYIERGRMLMLLVRDIDTLFTHLKSQGVTVVTAGGAPIIIGQNGNKTRGVVIKDPDGFHIVLLQMDPLPETTAPPTSSVIGARFALTVADTNQTMRVYRDVLGFEPAVRDFATDKSLNDLLNTPGAQIRRSTSPVPGSTLVVDFLEFKNIERKSLSSRLQDPGMAMLQLMVRDLDGLLKTLKAL